MNHFQYTQTLFKPKKILKTFKLQNTLILLHSNQLFSKFMQHIQNKNNILKRKFEK